MWLFAIFVIVPIIEIALFIKVGDAIGLWSTLSIVIATAVLGTFLVKRQGIRTLARLQNELAGGGNPVDPIVHGVLILVSGLLLLTPGFFTDAVGFSLLIPQVRSLLILKGAARFAGRIKTFHTPQNAPFDDGVVDADFTVEEPGPKSSKPSGWTKLD